MTSARRLDHNFALDRAVEWCEGLGLPLVIFEPLRLGYRWSSERMHRFVIEGMRDNGLAAAAAGVTYFPYVEPSRGAGRGLLKTLADRAAVVISDEFPAFFLPRMLDAAAAKLGVLLESVDSNGIVPLRSPERIFTTAASFRRHLQKTISPFLEQWPESLPLQEEVLRGADLPSLSGWAMWDYSNPDTPLELDFEAPVPAVSDVSGGSSAAAAQLRLFFDGRFERYDKDRNRVDDGAASGLSPYLHFGHISAHEIVRKTLELGGFEFDRVAPKSTGSRAGWWGCSPAAESFLDELITWRELGFNRSFMEPDSYADFSSLPAWARQSMDVHRDDPRDAIYSMEQFELSQTHDEIWNAAQRELVETGRMHNYLRMLWGKMIYAWSASPEDALEVMVHLNNKYALDGRDPNSYSGIFWTMGRYDRAWGPERPVFGKLRYMTSKSTRNKINLKRYLARFGPPPPLFA
ncbi:MAG: deoxyribodipyrimidine photo-lyase [Bradymonadia bacterium]|jgi:deoxyribodipyrimidine photo-lyase